MSEIEKMYENAGIKKQYCGWLDIGDLDTNVQYVRCATKEEYDNYAALDSSDLVQTTPNEEYPPFTAEKQIAILCWFANFYGHITLSNKPKNITAEGLQESLARLINLYWTGLPPEQQQQIKEILE